MANTVSINDRLGDGGLESVAIGQTDVNGVTSLVVGGNRIDNIAMGVPPGLDWLDTTLHGVDIYSKGFVRTPTLFFDPSATTSLNRGTLANPYNTQAALQTVIKGDMRGQVLGFKRGTALQASGTNGLTLAGVYGTSADPFIICPYGDAEALPIVSAHSVPTWSLVSGGIYKYAIGATEHDIWQNGTRVWKLNPTNGSTNNNTGTTVTNEATALTALAAKGAGWSVYISNTLYLNPYSGENPNLGQVYVSASDYGILMTYADIAATGYIEVAGLDVRYARKSAYEISAAAKTTISTIDGIKVTGCRIGKAGVDSGSPAASDALIIYGASDTQRITSMHIAGNECYDVLNNAIEISGVDGISSGKVVVEHNYGHDVGGNSVLELWSSCSGVTTRYNYGENASVTGRRYTSFAQGGVWVANKSESAGNWDNDDATNLKNVSNTCYMNLVKNPVGKAFRISGGATQKISHNTAIMDCSWSGYYGLAANHNAQFISCGETTNGPSAGFLNVSNNLFVAVNVTGSVVRPSYIHCQHATGGIPSGDGNLYHQDGANTSSNYGIFRAPGASKFSWSGASSWLEFTAASASNMDANSKCMSNLTGGTVTTATLNLNATTYAPAAASVALSAGITSLTGIGYRYKDGQPYAAATPTIGCYLGG